MKAKIAGALVAAGLMAITLPAAAGKVAVHGSVQADIVFPEVDNEINTGEYDHKILFNTYADVNLASQ